MGLTIHYNLRSGARTPREVRELLSTLRARALDLPFAQVGEIVELSGDACQMDRLDRDDPLRWLACQAERLVEYDGGYVRVPPTHLVAFTTQPGAGCEPANFGFCRYPTTVTVDSGPARPRKCKVGVKRGEWVWGSFCKTQYASDPRLGGVQNFLQCHLLVIALLDRAKVLGLLDRVSDEGGYWGHRDISALGKEVGHWNALIAGFAGQLKDRIGD